ncbi:MAG: histidinol-phosphatase [SAR324 cluster bacterium]|nr:histidinol-phosphatase [SAR324 cluster bacterium]
MTWNNYHTHTYRCQHATGDVIDYARQAMHAGSRIIGISDHTALPDNRWKDVRMTFSELDHYDQAFVTAKEELPEITILKGMECEYLLEYHTFYEDELLGQRKFDYLVGAGHYVHVKGEWLSSFSYLNTPAALLFYARYLCTMMESGLFAFIAHPDLFGTCNQHWNADIDACARDILETAQRTKIPLEINGNGFRRPEVPDVDGTPRAAYPWRTFWELAAEYDITTICNSDAHEPSDVLSNIEDGRALAKACGLRMLDNLKYPH